MGFFLEGNHPQEDENAYSAYWYMSMVTLEMLTVHVKTLSVT